MTFFSSVIQVCDPFQGTDAIHTDDHKTPTILKLH
jgi:hypothetical protein